MQPVEKLHQVKCGSHSLRVPPDVTGVEVICHGRACELSHLPEPKELLCLDRMDISNVTMSKSTVFPYRHSLVSLRLRDTDYRLLSFLDLRRAIVTITRFPSSTLSKEMGSPSISPASQMFAEVRLPQAEVWLSLFDRFHALSCPVSFETLCNGLNPTGGNRHAFLDGACQAKTILLNRPHDSLAEIDIPAAKLLALAEASPPELAVVPVGLEVPGLELRSSSVPGLKFHEHEHFSHVVCSFRRSTFVEVHGQWEHKWTQDQLVVVCLISSRNQQEEDDLKKFANGAFFVVRDTKGDYRYGDDLPGQATSPELFVQKLGAITGEKAAAACLAALAVKSVDSCPFQPQMATFVGFLKELGGGPKTMEESRCIFLLPQPACIYAKGHFDEEAFKTARVDGYFSL